MPLELIGGVLMAVVGVVAAVLANRLGCIAWRWLAVGAGLWFAAVLLKWQIDAVLHQPILGTLRNQYPYPTYLALGCLYIGLLTGVTEVVATLVAGLRWPALTRDARRAVGVGLGAGSFEAVFLGVQVVVETLMQPPVQLGTLSVAIFAPAAERLIVLVVHTVVRVMVLYAIATRRQFWFWVAFAYFTAIDGLCGLFILTDRFTKDPWLVEASYAPFALAGLPILRYLARSWPASPRN